MIVTRVVVQGFRCFVEPCGATFEPGAINILSAPNGSGKSTLLEALRMAFLISHKSAGEEVKACAPWGRALAPRVTVEYEVGGVRCRAAKQWLQGASSSLEQWRAGAWTKIAEGAAADERLRQAAGMPGGFDKGAKGRDEFWISVLWSLQGGLPLTAVDDSVVEAVRGSLNRQMEAGAADRIMKSIEESAALYWTPTGKAKKHSPVLAAEARLAEVRQRHAEADERLRQLEHLRGELLDVEGERECFAQRLPALEAQLKALAAAVKQRAEAQAARDKEKSACDLLGKQVDSMQDVAKRWRETAQRLEINQAKLTELEAGAPALNGDPDAALAAAQAKLKAAHAYLAACRERNERRALLDRCETAAAEVRSAGEALAAQSAPPAGEWPRLQKLHAEIRTTREKLESALVHVDVRAARRLELTVISGEPAGARILAPGESLRVSGSPVVEISVEGIGQWRASGPAASAAALRGTLTRLEQEWAQLTSRYGTESYAVLESRRAEAAKWEAALQERRASLNALLAGASLEALQKELLDFDSACAAHEAQYPDWASAPPQPEQIEQELRALYAQREARTLRDQMRDGELQIAAWIAEHGSRDALAKTLDDALLRLRRIELQIEAFDEQLSGFPADLDTQVAALTSGIEAGKQGLTQCRERSERLRGRIEQLVASAPYQSLAEAEEEAEEITRELAALRLAADAALLLRDTVARCRAALLDDTAGAVARDAGVLLRQITGAPLGELQLTAGLAPHALAPASWSEAVELRQFSGGENEQIHFATRLALADRLSVRERQLVVFDDVLMATDPERLERILALLDQRRERLQVLILTCHPERFAGLAGAHRVALNRPCP